MARCRCGKAAAIDAEKAMCKEHFTESFERKVVATIRKFDMVKKGEKVIVGSSGGKDSTTVLHILNKHFGNVEALAIDEGIPGYRSITLEDLEKFCSGEEIPLHVYSYKDEFGFSLKEALSARKDLSPCHMCGILRRYLLNTKARDYDKIATGHNLDDEAQSIMMNLVKAQLPLLARLGPTIRNADDRLVPRVKPLYFCSEKEVATYAFVNGLASRFVQCPHSHNSFRAMIRDELNNYEAMHKGAKRNLVESFLRMTPELKKEHKSPGQCSRCGQPVSREMCKACELVTSITEKI